jgi:hypothetical protein
MITEDNDQKNEEKERINEVREKINIGDKVERYM